MSLSIGSICPEIDFAASEARKTGAAISRGSTSLLRDWIVALELSEGDPVECNGARFTARPVFARSFFLAENGSPVLLSCQIFLHAQQIALAGTLDNS